MTSAAQTGQRTRMKLLASLVLALVACAAVSLSDASFVERKDTPVAATAATLSATNNRPGLAWVPSGSEMRPGRTVAGSIQITNGSAVTGKLRVRASAISGSATLPDAITATIRRTSGTPTTFVTAAKVNALAGTDVTLGSLAAGATGTYELELTWPAARVEAALRDTVSNLTFTWELRSS